MKYTASFDLWNRGTTIFVFVLLLAASGFILYNRPGIRYLTLLLIWAVPIVSYAFSPQYYIIEDKRVIIKRLVSSVVINRAEIKSVDIIPQDDMKWTLRVFGSGGFFGYYGKFSNKKFGMMTWYTTQRKNYVMLTLESGEKIVLTPDNPEEMVLRFV